jgi:hypothetical protein
LRAVLLSACLLAVGLAGCGGGGRDGGRTRHYEDFTVGWNAATQTMSVVRAAEPRDVVGQWVRLSSSGVAWNGGTTTLSGDVEITNLWFDGLWDVEAEIIGYAPSDQSITDDGDWYYGDLWFYGHSRSETWTFTDPNAVDFSFTVRVWYWR